MIGCLQKEERTSVDNDNNCYVVVTSSVVAVAFL